MESVAGGEEGRYFLAQYELRLGSHKRLGRRGMYIPMPQEEGWGLWNANPLWLAMVEQLEKQQPSPEHTKCVSP